jgi:DNA repair protein RadC
MWLQRFFGSRPSAAAGFPAQQAGVERPSRRGFAEEMSPFIPARPPLVSRGLVPAEARPGQKASLPFASTGPQGHRGRMRSRLLERGPGALADYEVLEMLLFLAFKQGDTKPLAKALINRYGSFAKVMTAPQEELLAIPGLGEHSVSAIKLVQDAALRLSRAELAEQPVLNNWDRLMDYLTAALSRETVEQFRVLFLDSRNRLLADEAQARGTVNHTPVYPREVIKRALELHATALILVHNHPSGDPTPSRADIAMTAEIRSAGELLSVVVHDHIIIGNGRQLSFRREGLL